MKLAATLVPKSFNKDLYNLIKAGKISKESSASKLSNPKALEMNLKGIFLSKRRDCWVKKNHHEEKER